MNTTIKTIETSPKFYARIAGALYLVIIIGGSISELFIRNKLIVPGDAAVTAGKIMSSPLLWRTGIAFDLLMHICDIPVMLILYLLLRPVNKHLALLSMLFNLIQTAVLVAIKLNLLGALFPLDTAEYLKAFDPQQRYALSYLAIRWHGYGYGIGLIFFAFVCIIEGYLIYNSRYFPKFIGVLMPVAGLCYLINSFSLILAPAFADKLFPLILLPVIVAELSFCGWLLIKGVNTRVWKERAAAAGFINPS